MHSTVRWDRQATRAWCMFVQISSNSVMCLDAVISMSGVRTLITHSKVLERAIHGNRSHEGSIPTKLHARHQPTVICRYIGGSQLVSCWDLEQFVASTM